VKRRFIRQNREIARVNSTQSLRIRNLEAEISRLLAENINIREQAINSAQEAERLRSTQRIFRDVGRLKEQLEAKLGEVGVLVRELGGLPEKAKRRSSLASQQQQRRRSGLVEVAKSPDQKDWRNRQTIGGVINGDRQLQQQEGRLPIIVEGKHYPRKTLEGTEISNLLQDGAEASESPEIGPPPVAHFDVAEPIDFKPAQQPVGAELRILDGDEGPVEDVKPLPDNLERRRRRRASALLEDMTGLNRSVLHASTEHENSMPLKSGAKRKLDVREDETKEDSRPAGTDDFAFQRRAIAADAPQPRAKGSRFTKAGTATTANNNAAKESATKLEPATRKVLAPKSTNSPSKTRRTTINEKQSSLKDGAAKEPDEQHPKPKSTARISVQEEPIAPPVQDIVLREPDPETDLQPKTPASLELFSPTSTEPSARVFAQPTEAAITTSVEDILNNNADGRTSRRARGAVSYAEPSLRAKMRRPTKELVAAVGEGTNSFKAQPREINARAESQERLESEDPSVIKTRTVTIKREKPETESDAWKGLPNAREKEEPTSPLVDKVAKGASRLSPAAQPGTHPATVEADVEARDLEKAIEGLSIFDPPSSSPPDHHRDSSPIDTAAASIQPPQSRKTSRRHSSNPASLRRVGQEFANPTALFSSDRLTSRISGLVGGAERPPRPNSAASLRNKEDAAEKGVLKRSASVSGFRRAAAVVKRDGDVEGGAAAAAPSSAAGMGRSERVAARRRSTMV
jgi:Shugoshin N-terminal coiled-coil region/Shugoshin C terminus